MLTTTWLIDKISNDPVKRGRLEFARDPRAQSNFAIESRRGPAPLISRSFRTLRSKLPISQRTSGPSYPMSQKGRMRRFVRDLTQPRVIHTHTTARLRLHIDDSDRKPAIERRGNHGGQSGMDYALRAS